MAETDTATVDRRARLIDAAAGLFGERSYDEVTTSEIARRAGVAYGLLAHHFGNKRGLYLAVIRNSVEHLRAVRDSPPAGDTPIEQLRNGLARHLAYVDDNADAFLAIMRGGIGADPDVRRIIDDLRWSGAVRILTGLGVVEPVSPVLRLCMHGWVGLFDELLIDHLDNRDVPPSQVIDIAVDALVSALRSAVFADPDCGLPKHAIDYIESVHRR